MSSPIWCDRARAPWIRMFSCKGHHKDQESSVRKEDTFCCVWRHIRMTGRSGTSDSEFKTNSQLIKILPYVLNTMFVSFAIDWNALFCLCVFKNTEALFSKDVPFKNVNLFQNANAGLKIQIFIYLPIFTWKESSSLSPLLGTMLLTEVDLSF